MCGGVCLDAVVAWRMWPRRGGLAAVAPTRWCPGGGLGAVEAWQWQLPAYACCFSIFSFFLLFVVLGEARVKGSHLCRASPRSVHDKGLSPNHESRPRRQLLFLL
jgi:hypothetical protein